MVTSSPEKLQNKKSFTDLIHLREELTKEAKNKERLVEFEKTIDLALEQGKKKGVIEFTETEWKTLISNENLPPIEEVKALLQEKIDSAKEVTSETKEKTGGLIEELEQKAEGLSGEAKKKIEELEQKAEGLKKYTKPGLWILGIGLSLKIWGYKIANWFSGLFGKKGEYDEQIKLAQMEKEFLENPEAAMKKYGADAMEKMKEKWEVKSEKKEGTIEKIAPVALLGSAGLGIFKIIKDRLPKSIRENIGDTSDEKSFLKKIATNRALRVFGISGLTLFGIGKLSETLQDPKIAAEIGEMPESPEEAKKAWWTKVIEKAGITIREWVEEIWSIINGEKLDEYLTEKENKEEMEQRWYVLLEEHPSIVWAKRELSIFEKRCEVFYNENKQAFEAAVAAGLILKPGVVLWAGAKWASVALSILKFATPGTVVPAGIVLALLWNAFEGIKHIQVPKDFGPEDIKDMLGIWDLQAFLEKQIPDITEKMHFESIAKEMQTLEQRIKEFNTKEFWEKIAWSVAEWIIESPQEKINANNKQGIQTLISSLELLEKEKQKEGLYWKLLWDQEKPGILQEIVNKLWAGNAITENDIRTMMEATEGTDIHIMPRDGLKTGSTIQWVQRDEHGNQLWLPRNICINPTIEHGSQYEAARDFVVNEYDLNALNVLGKALTWFREKASELAESIKNNHEKSGNLIEALLYDGWSIVTLGLETFVVDYIGNKYFLGPWNLVQSAFLDIKKPEDKLEMQEWLVEYGQWLAPVILIAGVKRWIQKKWFGILWWKLLLESITYPLHITKNIWKWSVIFGKYVYERIFAGDYKAVFSDPKNQFTAYFRENLHKFKWLQNALPGETARKIRWHHTNISKLEKARKLLYDAKQSSFWRSTKLEEAIKILEHESDSFEKIVGSRNMDSKSIRGILDKLENEIEEQRKLLSILENGVRQHFPTPDQWKNRATHIDSLKWFDISTEEGRKDAEKMLLESQREIEDMEKNRLKIEDEISEIKKKIAANPNNTSLQQALADKQKSHIDMMNDYHSRHRDLSEIREAMGELLHGRKPRILIGDNHIRAVKWLKWSAKVLGIIALTIGAGVAIEKISEAIHGDSSEADKWNMVEEGGDKYYGFRKDKIALNNEKKEKNEYTCESPEEFEKRIVAIETQYTESISKFFDPEFVNSLSGEEREKKIQEAADGHMIRVDAIKLLIWANKDMMEAYWNKKFTSEGVWEEIVPEEIRKQGVKAFMFIHRKDGKLTLEYMNHQEMKNVFYTLYDAAHESFLEGTLGEKGAIAADLTLRVAPFTGSFMDGKDAYQSFSRGNIGDGIMSTAWCIGGLVLDIGWFVSFGWSTAAGVALRSGKAGIKIAQTTWKALLHNGVQLWTQFGMKLAQVPRSESISIDRIPEPVAANSLLP